MRTKIPNLVKKLYPHRIWSGPKGNRDVYLTFDDGPIPGVTPWVLDQLKAYNARATFFCIGENIEKHPDIFSRILVEGHSVGNHTHNHLNGWKTDRTNYLVNTGKAQKVIMNEWSKIFKDQNKPNLFRPPYGKLKANQARALRSKGYRIVMWDVLSRDYSNTVTPETCYENVIRHTENGSIIVFHDSLKAAPNLEHTLPRVLHTLARQGYRFRGL